MTPQGSKKLAEYLSRADAEFSTKTMAMARSEQPLIRTAQPS
jgi:hypothetical protein